MSNLRLNEQIAFLRKQKGLSQEELAAMLGVTNQSVSKWENNICCPDIQLLPEIAKLFGVSVDRLLGYEPPSDNEDFILQLKEKFEALSGTEKADFVYKTAAALHTLVFMDYAAGKKDLRSGFYFEDALEHAAKAEWGYSAYYEPDLTTTMRKSSVFFSNNKETILQLSDIKRICGIIKVFSSPDVLKIAAALYSLTVSAEDIFVTVSEISEKSGFAEEKVRECVTGELLTFLAEKEEKESAYRFDGMYMNIIPIIMLLGF